MNVGETRVSVQHRCRKMHRHVAPNAMPVPCDECYSTVQTNVGVPYMPYVPFTTVLDGIRPTLGGVDARLVKTKRVLEPLPAKLDHALYVDKVGQYRDDCEYLKRLLRDTLSALSAVP